MSSFVVQPSEKTQCSLCGSAVDLLMYKDLGIDENHPAFYICFVCHRIAEVGKGTVEREGEV